MATGTLDEKSRLRIPRAIREALGLRPGDTVFYALVDGELRVRRAEDPYAGYGPIARQVRQELARRPEQFLAADQAMAELGVTQAEIDAMADLEDTPAAG